MRHFFALCIMRLLAYFLSCLLDQTNDLHTEIWTFFFYKNVQKVSVYNIVSKASFAYILIHLNTFPYIWIYFNKVQYIFIHFNTFIHISIHFHIFRYILGLFCHFNHTHSNFGILLSKYHFFGDKSNLTDYVSKSRPIHLESVAREKKQKFLKNVHQRLHVNYFLLKEFFFSISAVLLVYLSSLRLSSDHCCLSVIQFPSLTDQL